MGPVETAPSPHAANGVVHVIDDEVAVLHAVSLLLRSAHIPVAVHASAALFLAALAHGDASDIGCLLTDLRMPEMDGIALLGRLREVGFRRPVIVMTAHGDISTAVRAMKVGATDFIEKPFDEEELLAMLARARAMASDVPAEDAAGEARLLDAACRVPGLSPRERQVLRGLVAGQPNKVIARNLAISPRTVEAHRARLMARLGAHSLAEIVRIAILAGLGGDAPGE